MRTVDKYQDILDSRDIIERIEELSGEEERLKEELEEAKVCWLYHHDNQAPETCDNVMAYPEGQEWVAAKDRLHEWQMDNRKELDALLRLADEASSSPDWKYGETLIRDSYFEDYAQELAEDCGMIPKGLSWPCTCIDWEQAARELKMDYFSVDFNGVEYWIRA